MQDKTPTDDATETWIQVVHVGFSGDADQFEAFNDWYDNVHIPAMVATPGIRSCARYAARDNETTLLAIWEIDNLSVYQHPTYLAARGWGEFSPHIEWCTVADYQRSGAVRRFGTAKDDVA